MTVAEIIQLVRDQTKTTQTMIPDNRMVTYLNRVYKKFNKRIVDIDKDYFWTEWRTATVSWQNTYSLLDSNKKTKIFGQWSIEKVGIKYQSTDETRRNVDIKSFDNYPKLSTSELEKLATSADYTTNFWYPIDWPEVSIFKPICFIAANTIQIYPAPQESIADWIILQWQKRPYDLDCFMWSDDILVPEEYHDILALWMNRYVYQERNLITEKNDAIQEYRTEETLSLRDLINRKTTPSYTTRKSLNRYI